MAEVAQGDEGPRARGKVRHALSVLGAPDLRLPQGGISPQERCTNYVARGGLIKLRASCPEGPIAVGALKPRVACE